MVDADTVEGRARRVSDELAIVRTVARVARAQDDLDPVAYRNCFTDTVWLEAAVMIEDWQPGEISADELTRLTFATLSQAEMINHLVTNHIVAVDGDEATCAADLFAVAITRKDAALAASFIGARYFLRLLRTADGWRIRERQVTQRYRLSDPNIHVDAVTQTARP